MSPSGHGAAGQGKGEGGAGSILAVGIATAALALAALLMPLSVVLGVKQQAAGAADAAALAAADAAIGITPGPPCLAAETVAAANGATVSECTMDGVVVTVAVTVPAAGFSVPGIATAGPASDSETARTPAGED